MTALDSPPLGLILADIVRSHRPRSEAGSIPASIPHLASPPFDRFGIAVATTAGDVERIAAAITQSFNSPLLLDGGETPMSASVGVAFSQPDNDTEQLLRNADIAMYNAKAAGKGRFVVFHPRMQEQLRWRLAARDTDFVPNRHAADERLGLARRQAEHLEYRRGHLHFRRRRGRWCRSVLRQGRAGEHEHYER